MTADRLLISAALSARVVLYGRRLRKLPEIRHLSANRRAKDRKAPSSKWEKFSHDAQKEHSER
jgi:hypothetical protein